jgi:hypothetical protein
MFAERDDLASRLKVGADIGVEARPALESLLATGIRKGTTIEHEPTTVSLALKRKHMRWEGSFKGEACNLNDEV